MDAEEKCGVKMSWEAYQKYVGAAQPKSKLWLNLCKAFCIGGGICVLGQALRHGYEWMHCTVDEASAAVSLTLIALSAIATGLGWYDRLARHAGAGTLVPITGFANAVVSSALEFRSEGWITGMCAKLFTLAGPVLVMGISASVLYGLILCLFSGGIA